MEGGTGTAHIHTRASTRRGCKFQTGGYAWSKASSGAWNGSAGSSGQAGRVRYEGSNIDKNREPDIANHVASCVDVECIMY
jgi:hypothetical protein